MKRTIRRHRLILAVICLIGGSVCYLAYVSYVASKAVVGLTEFVVDTMSENLESATSVIGSADVIVQSEPSGRITITGKMLSGAQTFDSFGAFSAFAYRLHGPGTAVVLTSYPYNGDIASLGSPPAEVLASADKIERLLEASGFNIPAQLPEPLADGQSNKRVKSDRAEPGRLRARR